MAYATQTDLENLLGTQNVVVYSNLDNSATTANATRIAAALAEGDDWVNRHLRAAGYAAPLAAGSADFGRLTQVAVRRAAVWLYSGRGMQDLDVEGKPVNRMAHYDRESRNAMCELLANGIDGATKMTSDVDAANTGPTWVE